MQMRKWLSGVAAAVSVMAAQAADVLIYGPPTEFSAALEQALQKYSLKAGVAETTDFSGYRMVVLPPGVRCADETAASLRRFSGALLVMDTENLGATAPGTMQKTLLEDWDTRVKKPAYRFGGDKRGTLWMYQAEHGIRFAEISNQYFRDGSIYLEINRLDGKIKADDQYLLFNAMGGADSDLLSVNITDRDGNQFVSYAPLDRTPREVALRFADFLAFDSGVRRNYDFGGVADDTTDMLKGEKVIASGEIGRKLDPSRISTITIGLSRRHLWWDKGGLLRLGPVYAGAPEHRDDRRSGYARRFDVPYQIVGITIPDAAFDPLDGAVAVNAVQLAETPEARALFGRKGMKPFTSGFDAIPDRPLVHGREKNDKFFVNTVRARSDRRIPLLADERGQAAAMLVLPADEMNPDRPLALFGLPETAYRETPALFDLAAAAADYLVNRPQIVNVVPNVRNEHLSVKIFVNNPSAQPVAGTVTMQLADLKPVSAPCSLKAGETATVVLEMPEIPGSFPFTDFSWSVRLSSPQGADVWSERVDVRKTCDYLIEHLRQLAGTHADGRFSHHYFSDIYGARAFAVIGLRQNRPELVQEARRLVDGIVSRQTPEGGLPMGYGEQRRICWVADNGTAMIGILEFAAMFPELRQRYLECARRYYDWRETFYMDDARVAKLEKEFGKDPRLIRKGFYGIGYNDGLFYTKGKFKETVRVERGEAWVNGISMVSLPLYYQMTGDRKILEIARRNLREYLPHMSKVNYFGAESLFQMYRMLPDQETADLAKQHLRDAYLSYIFDEDDDYLMFDKGGRRSLDVVTALYCRNSGIEDSPRLRAYLVKNLLIHCSESLPLSVHRVGASYRHSTHGSSIAAARYAGTLSLFWLTELLYPGSTLIKPEACVDYRQELKVAEPMNEK